MFCAALAAMSAAATERSTAAAATERSSAVASVLALGIPLAVPNLGENEACRALPRAPGPHDGPPRGAFPATRTHRATSKLHAQFQTTQNCARPSAPRNALTAPSPPAGPVGVDGVDAPRRRCRRAPAARCAARRLRGREHLLDQTHEDGEEVRPRLREGAPRRCCPSPSQLSQFRNARTSPRSSPSARRRTAATSSRSARRARRSRSPTRSRAAPCRT